jgi:predicted ATPase
VGSATPETTRAALCERVWRISEGNPFIAVECVRARQEGISVEPEAGSGLPARARTMLLGRIERLGEQSRALLEAAAVIGRDFEFELVQRAAGLDEPAAAHALEELVRRRLVHGVDERFDFTHDRIWEVVSEQLPPLRRRLLHGAVARAIEAVHAAELGPHHAALGVHWSKAQAWDRAVTHLRALRGGAPGAGAPAADRRGDRDRGRLADRPARLAVAAR